MGYAPIWYSDCAAMIRKGRNGTKKLQNNTYLIDRGDHYAVRYHRTDVVGIWPDGTYTLDSGGWETITTQQRINNWSPGRVGSAYTHGVSGWVVQSHNTGQTTEPKVQKCRTCSGRGIQHFPASYRYWDYSVPGKPVRLDPPVESWPASDSECYRCNGTGQTDYGSKTRYVPFFPGVRVDSDGQIVGKITADLVPETMADRKAREERNKRESERMYRHMMRTARANTRAFFQRLAPVEFGGKEMIVYKAVDNDLKSGYDFVYPIGETVTAPDWNNEPSCHGGLFFCASPDDAKGYHHRATRYLACAVRERDSVAVGGGHSDKIKARKARVLYETCIHGERLGQHNGYAGLMCPKGP